MSPPPSNSPRFGEKREVVGRLNDAIGTQRPMNEHIRSPVTIIHQHTIPIA
jgi:hypothetical protein